MPPPNVNPTADKVTKLPEQPVDELIDAVPVFGVVEQDEHVPE
jgi:hypothetical protein